MINDLLAGLDISILNVGKKENGREWNYKGVISPYCRLCMVTEGEAYIRHHDQEFHLTPGTLHLVPSFTLSEYECPDWFSYYYVHFTSRMTNGMDLFNVVNCNYTVKTTEFYTALFARLVTLLPEDGIVDCRPHSQEDKQSFLKPLGTDDPLDAQTAMETDGIFRIILSLFFENCDGINAMPSENFSLVLEHIEEHLSEPLSIEVLAGLVSLHPNYFSDQFARVFGIRPVEYIIRRRIEHAQSLILGQTFSMKEIAELTGFCDLAYFSRTFKKYTGIAPSKYFKHMNL